MKESDTDGDQRLGSPVNPRIMAVIAGVVVLLSPMIITLTSSILSIHAMSWYIEFRWYGVVVGYDHLFSALPLTASRLIFVYQVFRYYKHRSTRATTVFVGLVAELPMGIIGSLFLFANGIPIPTPFLLIFAIAIMWKLPYAEPQKPW